MKAITPLLTALRYLWIRHECKLMHDWIPAGLCVLLYHVANEYVYPIPFAGSGGVVECVSDILRILVGFYIASLCAVATFGSPSLDQKMEGTPPTIREKRRNEVVETELTRRRYLCYLFGYLAFLSMALYLAGVAATWIAPVGIKVAACPGDSWQRNSWVVVRFIGTTVYIVFASQLFVLTLLGLHYLAERIHR